MKTLIVTLAVLMLLLVFPLQSILDTVNQKRMEKFNLIVHNSCQTARTDGYFRPSNIEKIRNDILSIFPDITESDIVINVTTTPKYRLDIFDEREVIEYEISVPIKKVIAVPSLFGFSKEDNTARYGQRGYVLSEVLMP